MFTLDYIFQFLSATYPDEPRHLADLWTKFWQDEVGGPPPGGDDLYEYFLTAANGLTDSTHLADMIFAVFKDAFENLGS